jgi:hypothetical protein
MTNNLLGVEAGRIEHLHAHLRDTFAQLPPRYHKALDQGEVIAGVVRGTAGYAAIGWRDPADESDEDFRQSDLVACAVALVTKELRGLVQLIDESAATATNATDIMIAVLSGAGAMPRAATFAVLLRILDRLDALDTHMSNLERSQIPPQLEGTHG